MVMNDKALVLIGKPVYTTRKSGAGFGLCGDLGHSRTARRAYDPAPSKKACHHVLAWLSPVVILRFDGLPPKCELHRKVS
jgi:hypothetical protein